jgi:hypothetical protein
MTRPWRCLRTCASAAMTSMWSCVPSICASSTARICRANHSSTARCVDAIARQGSIELEVNDHTAEAGDVVFWLRSADTYRS